MNGSPDEGLLGPAAVRLLESGQCVMLLTGEVDLAVTPDLVTEFEYAISHLSPQLVIDVNGVDFIDSSGLGALVMARRRALEAGGEMVLVSGNEQLDELLALTRLDEFFSIHESVEAAVSHLDEPRGDSAPEPPA